MNTINMNDTIRAIVAYAEASSVIERATQTRTESRKLVAEFVRDAHGKQWKTVQKPIKAAIDGLTVGIVADKVGLLGVIKTCVEYGIMPTTLNADRLRKAKTWTTIDGKIIPNGYGKVHKVEGAGQKAQPKLDVSNTSTVAASLAPTANTQPQTTPKVPSTKAATPQKTEDKVHPLSSNVSSSDAPISPREHFGILFGQLLKNETFRTEYVEILACMLEVDKATLTRCLVQARDEIK